MREHLGPRWFSGHPRQSRRHRNDYWAFAVSRWANFTAS